MDRLSIAPHEVHLWLQFYEQLDSPALLEEYRRLLSEVELQRLSRLCFERDKVRYLVTRALVRVALSRYCEVAPQDWRFSENAFGRPAIANRDCVAARLRFNISHTTGLIVLGVTLDRELGVDAEMLGRQADLMALATQCFADVEAKDVATQPPANQRERFFDYWTLKEAYVKALGKGLSVPLDQVRFRFFPDSGISTEFVQCALGQSYAWRFWLLRPSSRHVAAVCADVGALPELRLSCRQVVPLRSEELIVTPITRRSN